MGYGLPFSIIPGMTLFETVKGRALASRFPQDSFLSLFFFEPVLVNVTLIALVLLHRSQVFGCVFQRSV